MDQKCQSERESWNDVTQMELDGSSLLSYPDPNRIFIMIHKLLIIVWFHAISYVRRIKPEWLDSIFNRKKNLEAKKMDN